MSLDAALVARIAALVAAYDGFGSRRAGTAGDLACAAWLGEAVAAAGVALRRAPIAFERIAPIEAWLAVEDDRIDGLPLFDAPDGEMAGRLVSATAPAGGDTLGFLAIEPGAASIKGQPLEALRKSTRHRALIVATRGAGGSLAPINAQYFNAPFGPPVLQVAGMYAGALEALAAAGTPASLRMRSERIATHSENLVAEIAGASAAPLVLLTPRTSWYESTAERAGGIVAWLEALRHAATLARQAKLARPIQAFATCGHELGHLGLERVLHEDDDFVRDARAWLHLGANLGCASDGHLTLRAADADDGDRMQAALAAHGYPRELIVREPIDRAMGEARDLALHGARVVSLIGRNAHFHAPSDRWPGNVNVRWLASLATAVQEWMTHA